MPARPSIRARRWTVGAAIAVTLAVVSVAFAAPWTAESNGKAGAKSGGIDPVMASEATPTSELLPGESADAALTLTNPNKVAMVVTSIAGNGPITSSSAACNDAGHGVTFADQTGSWPIAKNAALDVSLPSAVQMALDSANECQNVTFSIPVRVTASVTNSGGGTPTTTTAPTTTTTAAPPQLMITPDSHNYGQVPVGQSSPTAGFTVKNVGGSSDIIHSTELPSPDFQIVSSCNGAVLAPGGSCQTVARFTPTSGGLKQAQLRVTTSQWRVDATAALSGTGLSPALLNMHPPTVDYGTIAAFSSARRQVFVQNEGQQSSGPLSFTLTGPDADSFTLIPVTCSQGAPLAAGANCFVEVEFRPGSPRQYNATLTVNASPGGSDSTNLVGQSA